MNKLSITDVTVKGKMVFVRVDFNVPLNDNGEVTDDTRIRASLPTLRHLVVGGAKIVCASHLGRPKGKATPEFSLKPVAQRLAQLMEQEVIFTGDTIGAVIRETKAKLNEGDILLLENLWFHQEEITDDDGFAGELAANIDIYVNDAFSVSHRTYASLHKIMEKVPVAAAGFLLEKEITFLGMATLYAPKNSVAILGGAKVADKIPVILKLMENVGKILIGGAMAYTFLKARGIDVGNSLVENDFIPTCKEIMKKAADRGVEIFLPMDHVSAFHIEPDVTVRMIKQGESIPQDMMGLDIGFDTINTYTRQLQDAQLIVWNGPMGVFEIDTFASGTMEIAKAVAASDATSIVGGDDSVAAVNKAGVTDQISHISAGGGASLEFLSGEALPGIESLTNV